MNSSSRVGRNEMETHHFFSRSQIPFGQLRAGTLNEVTSLRGDHAFHDAPHHTMLMNNLCHTTPYQIQLL